MVLSLLFSCSPVLLSKNQMILLSKTISSPVKNQGFRAGSQVRPTPSFLKILWSTSPSMTVECT